MFQHYNQFILIQTQSMSVESKIEYEVENILEKKMINKKAYYFIKWKVWTYKPLIYKRLMSKICNNVRHYIMTAIQWSFNVKILYW